MEELIIEGGVPLQGHVKAAGAKNAITKMLVASLLSDRRCYFTNVPCISEVDITLSLLKEIGSEIVWDKEKSTLEIQTKELKTTYIPQRFSGANRIPILMIGALLGRTDEDIIVPTAGGCKIGARPVDFHIEALEKLGATIEYRMMKKEGAYFARAHNGLKGNQITLSYPSVGATENSLLAACRAKGTTVIKNIAIEPEILDLILFLQKMGVIIHLDQERTLRVQQCKEFHDVHHHVVTDRIEVASFALAAIATKGRVFVEGAKQVDMLSFLSMIRQVGGGFDVKNEGIEFFYQGALHGGLHLETNVHPGFLTDWQQLFVVLLTQAQGISVVHETVYENRFGYTDMLLNMGADIQLSTECFGSCCRFHHRDYQHTCLIKGPTPLKGSRLHIPDLRAGFAYVLAALIAQGSSTITGLPYLDRGYEHLSAKLQSLGASIQRESKTKDRLVALTS
jgi:UDP-N-acetylglucosamine 1-carboxyvinyltransferase